MMAFLALAGNSLVLLGRWTSHNENRCVSLVIMNLAAADWLMGIYLAVIGLQDVRWRKTFHTVAQEWVGSWTCTAVRMVAMVSCEVSLLILTFMSVERFLLIAKPFRLAKQRIQPSNVLLMMVIIWVMGITLSVFPGW